MMAALHGYSSSAFSPLHSDGDVPMSDAELSASSSRLHLTTTSPPPPLPSREFFFQSADLVSFLCRFLSIDDLLLCSSLSSHLHAVLDSNAVWRHRLLQAKHIQSFYVPLEIQPPYVEADEEEEESKTPSPPLSARHRRRSSLTCPPPSASTAVFDSSLAAVAEVCCAFYARRLRHVGVDCQISPVAILPLPSSPTSVFHLKFLLTRRALENQFDCRSFALRRAEGGEWEVQAMGDLDTGYLVLNEYNMEQRDTGVFVITQPPPPAKTAKGQYVDLLRCSEDAHTGCRRLLRPSPALPPPRPTPAWFSMHLAALSFRHVPFPAIPPSLYPAFHPLPVCAGCRQGVLAAVDVFCQEWAHQVDSFAWHIDCLVRINAVQWDARWKEFEDEIRYHRLCIRRVDDADRHTAEGQEGLGASQLPRWCVERIQLFDDCGVYAVNTASNLPWTNPTPPSPHETHPPELLLHEHPLRHYARSVYRSDEYGCDVCGESHEGQDVWHCSFCQFDCCARAVAEARASIATAQEARLELMRPLKEQQGLEGGC